MFDLVTHLGNAVGEVTLHHVLDEVAPDGQGARRRRRLGRVRHVEPGLALAVRDPADPGGICRVVLVDDRADHRQGACVDRASRVGGQIDDPLRIGVDRCRPWRALLMLPAGRGRPVCLLADVGELMKDQTLPVPLVSGR